MIWHVHPVNDEAEHVTVGTCCRCQPRVELSNGDMIIVHRSFDGREVVEEAEAILRQTEATMRKEKPQ